MHCNVINKIVFMPIRTFSNCSFLTSSCYFQVNGVMEDSVASTSSNPATTRGIWLIGGVSDSITGSKLPSNRQVLSRFFFLHTLEKKTVQESTAITAEETISY